MKLIKKYAIIKNKKRGSIKDSSFVTNYRPNTIEKMDALANPFIPIPINIFGFGEAEVYARYKSTKIKMVYGITSYTRLMKVGNFNLIKITDIKEEC